MFDLLFAASEEAIAVTGIVFGGPLVAWVLTSWVENWRKARESEHQAVLKQQMLDRGMTAEDIEKVLGAGQGKPPHLMR